jgi:hypothetical protein
MRRGERYEGCGAMGARDWRDVAGVGRILTAGGGSARARDEQKESLGKESAISRQPNNPGPAPPMQPNC